jgi:hypothetical protein
MLALSWGLVDMEGTYTCIRNRSPFLNCRTGMGKLVFWPRCIAVSRINVRIGPHEASGIRADIAIAKCVAAMTVSSEVLPFISKRSEAFAFIRKIIAPRRPRDFSFLVLSPITQVGNAVCLKKSLNHT